MNTRLLVPAHWSPARSRSAACAALCGRSSATTTGCSGSTRRDRSECWPSAPRPLPRVGGLVAEIRLHGVIAAKLYTYASDARVRRWPNGIEIT